MDVPVLKKVGALSHFQRVETVLIILLKRPDELGSADIIKSYNERGTSTVALGK